MKPAPPPSILQRHATYLECVGDWISRHKVVTAAVVAFVGTGSIMVYHSRASYRRRRRAKRAGNGARKEVVVLAGPSGSLVTKSLMLDLERRGFVVYCVVQSREEEKQLQALLAANAEIRPLYLAHDVSIDRHSTIHIMKLIDQTANGSSPSDNSFPKPYTYASACISRCISSRAGIRRAYISSRSQLSVRTYRGTHV